MTVHHFHPSAGNGPRGALSRLRRLRRPRLLVRAARFGLPEYRRTAGLKRLFARTGATTPQQIVAALFDAEAAAEEQRCANDAAYSPARHVELLIALMAEIAPLCARPDIAGTDARDFDMPAIAPAPQRRP